jgi:type I restriction enzyme S subunit
MVGEVVDTSYGPISSDFGHSLLSDLCVPDGGVQTGPFGSQLHASDYVDYGTPIITVEHLGDNRIIHENLPCVSDEDKDRLSKYILQTGDIVFSRVGSVDRRAVVHPEEDGWLFSGRCLRVRPDPKKVDAGYLSWFLGLPGFKEYIRRIAVGATMPSLNTTILSNVPIYFPPTPQEQQAIAGILGALDDRIELNRRTNQTLEGIARAIFKSWFVDFDPVRAKVAGQQPPGLAPRIADLFPDAFEESGLGEIPKGWEVASLHAVATLKRESFKPMQAPTKLWEHYSIPAFDAGRVPLIEAGEAIKSAKYHVPSSCVLASKLNPQFSRVWLPDVQDEMAAICSTEFMPFVPLHDGWRPFLYELMKSDVVQRGIQERVTGSTGSRQRAKPEDVAAMSVVVPSSELTGTFSRAVGPLHEKTLNCILGSRTLAALRDTLLPRLISGELRVPDAERIVGRCT